MAVRLLIIAADPLVRAGLAAMLQARPEVDLVGQVAPDDGLLDWLEVFQPDVALLDLGWEAAPMLESLRQLAETGLPIVALLPETSAAAALETGALGLLRRETQPEQLLAALQAAGHGLLTIDPRLRDALRPPLPSPAPVPLLEALTPREVEVLHLLAQGLSNKLIAIGSTSATTPLSFMSRP
jgi:DNA-binding NarL/FixJ family response regulator